MYQHQVQYYETDKMGIVHHSNYIRWMEEARVDFLDRIGWNYAKLEDTGIISPVVSVDCKYKKPTKFGETIAIDVIVEEFRGVRLKLKYLMYHADGEVVCECRSEHCFLSAEGRPVRMNREYPSFYETLSKFAEK